MEIFDQDWNTSGTTGLDFLRCPSCNMTFKSSLLLEKHRDKFCIGGDIGKVRDTQTPQDMLWRVKDYKRRNQEQRRNHDAKERYILDNLNGKEQRLTRINSEPTYTEKRTFGKLGLGPSADDMRKQQLQLRTLAEAHGRLMADIVAQNKKLEKQRDEIMRRLNEFSEKNKNSSQLEALLLQLKAQENKNEILVESMRQQIQFLQMEAVRTKNQRRHTDTRMHLFQNGRLSRQQTFVPFYGGGSLCSEISALRMTYLQNGGSDPMILTQLNELLAEAQKVEEGNKQRKTRHKEKNRRDSNTIRRNLNVELIALEIENQRLEDEILKLQLQRHKESRFPKTYYRKVQPGTSPAILQDENAHKAKNLKSELELLKNELEIQRLKRIMKTGAARQPSARPPQSGLPPLEGMKPQTPGLTKHFLDSSDGLGPAPYDPVAGFTLFYDFLLGLDPSLRVCRLVVGLYSEGQEMGNPSPLPPVYCETGSLTTYFSDSKLRNKATLATKQAVPRVRPSTSISLIIELQASGGYDPYRHEVNHLISRGWAKIDIFDGHHRVISGRWKIPIRILPVKPSMTSRELNGVPQLENTELFIRLVNSRDADMQSFLPIDPSNAGLYKYPPLASAWNSGHPDASRPPFVLPHNYLNSHHMYPSFIESVDPPPLSKPVSAAR
ncbi:coiled-coil domain-containing protein 17-like [Protopterus annectens]|uniref:coiled-coil domain-containing protein 17-like n=1 Tax=Protopterus annectens TaxID=7888 RepID=UPI001CFB7C0A|nr:coiled-coil domain-containing protein 17-like [Protopterus annectens]